MSAFVKICGICSRKDLEQICALGPDAIGFIFWPKSKRYVRPEQVSPWLTAVPEGIKKVGVFVEPKADEVEEVARECRLDVVQIHLTSNDWKIEKLLSISAMTPIFLFRSWGNALTNVSASR